MTIEVFLNQIGFPRIAELPDQEELPGIGEKITLKEDSPDAKTYEVTEVKKDTEENKVYIYVNTVK